MSNDEIFKKALAGRDAVLAEMCAAPRNDVASTTAAIAWYLRRKATDCMGHAQRLRADSSQNIGDARLWESQAGILEQTATEIDEGRHWR